MRRPRDRSRSAVPRSRGSPGSGDALSPAWRRAWARREGFARPPGDVPETQGRGRDLTSHRRERRRCPAGLCAGPAVCARSRPQRPGLPRRPGRAEPLLGHRRHLPGGLPDHDALMLIDIVNAGWVPIYNLNLSEDVPGYLQAPATALSYPWTHFIGGHLGRLGTRDDISLHQQYIADIQAGAREALATVDPTPYFVKYEENVWAAVKGYLDELTDAAAKPVIAKYTGVLAAADVEVFTTTTTFMILQSKRLDLGPSAPLHP